MISISVKLFFPKLEILNRSDFVVVFSILNFFSKVEKNSAQPKLLLSMFFGTTQYMEKTLGEHWQVLSTGHFKCTVESD